MWVNIKKILAFIAAIFGIFMNHIPKLKKFKLFLIINIMLIFLFSTSGLADTVKLIQEFSSSTQENAKLYFDQNNQLRLITKQEPGSRYIAEACNTAETVFNSPSHKIQLLDPRVDIQKCLPNAEHPNGFDLVLGLNSDDSIRWKYLLTIPLSTRTQDFREVIGSSDEGIIVHSSNTGLIEILNPNTGEKIYPLPSSIPIPRVSKQFGVAIYNADKKILYKVKENNTKDIPNELYEINLNTGKLTKLLEFPNQFLTKVSTSPYRMAFSGDKKYLILIAHVNSRFFPSDKLMIFDLNKRKWVYEKKIVSPYPNASQLIVKGNNIGLLSNDGKGKFLIQHFVIESD